MIVEFTRKHAEVHCDCGNFSWNVLEPPTQEDINKHIRNDHPWDGKEKITIHLRRLEAL